MNEPHQDCFLRHSKKLLILDSFLRIFLGK